MPQHIAVPIGARFSKLTVTGAVIRGRGPKPLYPCTCDCGNTTLATSTELRTARKKSCGCLIAETTSRIALRHGQARRSRLSPEFVCWRGMLARCKSPRYTRYYGRGIRVCERWQQFENFFADMGPRPSPGHSIDRYPNNDGDYEPGNCRWATPSEQARNTQKTRLLAYAGTTLCVKDWAEKLGVRARLLQYYLSRNAWSLERVAPMLPALRGR